MFYLNRGLNAGTKLTINEVDVSTMKDGDYTGKYLAGRWTNEVKVTVKGGKMTELNVVKDVTFPKSECTTELFDRVLKKQTTMVDAISGSTVTSKAYLKSIENALNK